MPRLKSVVDSLPTLGAHPEFRLWMTAAVTGDFPLSILQASLKASQAVGNSSGTNFTQCEHSEHRPSASIPCSSKTKLVDFHH